MQKVVVVKPKVGRYDVEELKVDLTATYDNPFDPTDVAVDAEVTAPDGSHVSVPGFFYRAFDRALKDGKEAVSKSGDPEWRIRVNASALGENSVIVTVRDRSGTISSKPVSFTVTESAHHGFVRVSPRSHQYFEWTDGTSYFPLGVNMAWGNDPGTFSYDSWIPDYGKVNANYLRIWLGPAWVTCGLEQTGKSEDGKGMGQLDLGNAWKLDHILQLAASNGMNAMLTIDSYNTLRAHTGYPAWDKAPQNKDNGGPIRIWTDFWTNSQIERFYKAKIRYLVARYSAYSNVMAWEFWNEVDLTEDYSLDVVQNWHQRMGDFLRASDPYHHLVTTSQGDSMGNRSLDLLPQLDFFQTHSYNNPDVAGGVLYQQSRKSEWGKPHFVGEIGADAGGPRTEEDPTGLQIHDPLWMSIATGSSGSAMPWWWDSLIAPKKLYPLFGSAAAFVKDVDWPGEDFRRVNFSISYQTPPKIAERKDLVFEGGPIQWKDGEANRPKTVSVIKGRTDGDIPLPGILHGVRNHRDWHNPVRFKVNLQQPNRFEVLVGEVSGYGGATLQVSLDGDPVMTRDFAAGENAAQGQSVSKFSGVYGIDVPTGEHTITVENIGNDWFMVSYRFPKLLKRSGPPIQAWGIEGKSKVLIWARPEGRTWRRVIVDKQVYSPVVPSLLEFDGVAPGKWHGELWDTWKGSIISEFEVQASFGGRVKVPVSTFAKDIAIKLTRHDTK